jgi:hypothetical protein
MANSIYPFFPTNKTSAPKQTTATPMPAYIDPTTGFPIYGQMAPTPSSAPSIDSAGENRTPADPYVPPVDPRVAEIEKMRQAGRDAQAATAEAERQKILASLYDPTFGKPGNMGLPNFGTPVTPAATSTATPLTEREKNTAANTAQQAAQAAAARNSAGENYAPTPAGPAAPAAPVVPVVPAAPVATPLTAAQSELIAVTADRFAKYNLTSLLPVIKKLAVEGATEATISITLQETPEYKTRFKANDDRIKKGLKVLTPAEYLNVEDSYRQVLRAYGLKQFDTDAYVSQFIANDMSPTELSNRVQTAVQRVQNADPGVSQTLRDYYGIGQADLVGYVLDPAANMERINRQVSAAEIGNAARVQGLNAGVAVSEQLASQGITQAEAQKGYSTIADILPTAEKLSGIYGTQMPGYDMSAAEQETFNGLASAQRKRKRLSSAEIASFSGATGTNKTSLTTSSRGQI